MPLHAPLPPTSPQPPEEPPLPDEDEDLSSKESEYESSDEEDRQRFVMWHTISKNKNVEKTCSSYNSHILYSKLECIDCIPNLPKILNIYIVVQWIWTNFWIKNNFLDWFFFHVLISDYSLDMIYLLRPNRIGNETIFKKYI